MQQRGQGLDRPRKVQLVDALGKVRPNTRPLERTVPGMSDSKVSTSPLLQQSRQQCAREAHEQAQKPERVDPDGRYRRRELGRVRQ